MRKLKAQSHLTARHYLLIAKEARYLGLPIFLEWMTEDLLTEFPRESDPAGFIKAAIAILTYMGPNCPLSPIKVIQLYNAVVTLGMADHIPLPNHAWTMIFEAAIKHPEACRFTLDSFVDAFFAYQLASGRFTFSLINLANMVTIELLMRGKEEYPQAMAVFQKMVKHDLIPGLEPKLLEGGSFKVVVARSIIRGYLRTGTFAKAINLMNMILRDSRWAFAEDTTQEDLQYTGDLAIEVLNSTLQAALKTEVLLCRNMIQLLVPTDPSPVRHTPFSVGVPDATVLAFYDACRDHGLYNEAATLYVRLQSQFVRQRHVYPPPRGNAIYWLFDYFADPGLTIPPDGEPQRYRGYTFMATTILNGIIKFNLTVPVLDRPKILAIAAGRGFLYHTRTLYEMWTDASDPDHQYVQGSPQIVVPMAKLFVKTQEFYDKNKETAPADTKVKGMEDGWEFATKVVDTYIDSLKPMAKAPQANLNAMARALITLDRIPEAIAALYITMRRMDIPDTMDINVALLAVAKYSVRKAIETLEYMITRGLTPTASTFSMLIHRAVKSGERHYIPALVARASELGLGELTPKGLATLAQHELSPVASSRDEESHKKKVELVFEMVKTVMDYPSTLPRRFDQGKDHMLSVRMGERYVHRALEIGDGKLAVELWRVLLKDRVRWTEASASELRRAIAEAVAAQGRDGRLKSGETRALISELGFGTWPLENKNGCRS